jgi:hypothetical protein
MKRADTFLTLVLAWLLGMGLFLLARESLGPASPTPLKLFPAGVALLCALVVARALEGSRWRLSSPPPEESAAPVWPESPRLRLLVDLVAAGLGIGGLVELLRGERLLGGGLVGLLVLHLLARLRAGRVGEGRESR